MSNYDYAQATDDQLFAWFEAANQDAYDELEAQEWERQMRQVRWAEAGGYRAGLARPAW